MSIIAANELEAAELETAVAIIGAGAAGFAIAKGLRKSAIVIESGSRYADRRREAKFAAVVSGEPLDTEFVRIRAIGGATVRWTGRCTQLDAVDFQDRPWLGAPTWPIGPETMKRWYDEAWRFLNIGGESRPLQPQNGFGDSWLQTARDLRTQSWYYAFARRDRLRAVADYSADLFSGDKHLVWGADCVELSFDGARVVSVTLVDRRGRRVRVKAQRFVLAAGCIETVRLLLCVAKANGGALGPVERWLGRGFHQHLRFPCEHLPGNWQSSARLQKTFNRFRHRKFGSTEIGLALKPEAIFREQLTNASVNLRYSPRLPHSLVGAPTTLIGKLRGREPHFNCPEVRLEADVEQTIDRESCITLAEQTDCHGLPRADIRWKINEVERRTALFTMKAVNDLLERNGLGAIKGIHELTEADISGPRLRDSLHHLGGTRMSADPSAGVVDPDCRVHQVANLWIAGGSVFATGGHANPTLTIVALALRLADHLNRQGDQSSVPAPMLRLAG